MPRRFSDAQIWSKLVEELGAEHISRKHVQQALEDSYRIQGTFLDASDPHCLYPVTSGDDEGIFSVECGEPATRRSHSIQKDKSLKEIASFDGGVRGGGPYVYQFSPDIQQALHATSGPAEDGRTALGQVWPWEITKIDPKGVTIEQASVRHFACNLHDQSTHALARADNFAIPELGDRRCLDERDPSTELGSFLEDLFVLAHRTLLYRISQLRGAEQAAAQLLQKRSADGNRYAVDLILDVLRDLSGRLTELYREKLKFDQRIMDGFQSIQLIHHISKVEPTVRYACAEYTTIRARAGNQRTYVWVSVNVLPLEGITWLIMSHQAKSGTANYAIRSEFESMSNNLPYKRRGTDLRLMGNFLNLYVAPDDFRNLAAEDQAELSSSVAQSVFGDTLSKGLALLGASDGGQVAIGRANDKLRA